MYFTHKKSKITGWWVAEEGTVLTFANICSDKPRGKKMKIVGYLKDSSPYYPELATSTNYVVKVTKKGVITSKGTCYPFREAHALYLEFLSQANKENTLIATDWELNENTMIASIISNGEVKENITFEEFVEPTQEETPVEEPIEFKPVILQSKVSLADLEKQIEEEKKKKSGQNNYSNKKKNKVEEEKVEKTSNATRMDIYTQEELDAMEEEYEKDDYMDDEEINYDDYDEYYDEK